NRPVAGGRPRPRSWRFRGRGRTWPGPGSVSVICRLEGLRSRVLRGASSPEPLRLTVASGVLSARAAAERLPASTAVSRIDIDSKRSIDTFIIWKDSSRLYDLLRISGRSYLQAFGMNGRRTQAMSTHSYSSDVAFTSAVKAIQVRKGSRGAYARVEERGGWQTRITPDLAGFIEAQTSVFLAPAH